MTDAHSEISDKRFLRETGLALQIAALIEPALEDLGFRLVQVAILGRAEKQTVQIMAEKPDGTILIEDCVAISRQLSPLLDAYDLIPGTYALEVSSPGIDRPLVRPSDFETWGGYQAKVELTELIDGRKRFRGVLEGFEGGEIRLEVDLDQIGVHTVGLPIGLVADARLVLTDDLVRESLRRSKLAAVEAAKAEAVSKEDALAEDGSVDDAVRIDDADLDGVDLDHSVENADPGDQNVDSGVQNSVPKT